MDPIEPLMDANQPHDDLSWLIQQANQGEQQALGELIRLLLPMAYRYLAWLTSDPEAALQAAPLGLLLIGQKLHKADRARSAEEWLVKEFSRVYQPPAVPLQEQPSHGLAGVSKLSDEQRRLLGLKFGAGLAEIITAGAIRKTEAEIGSEIENALSILAGQQKEPDANILKGIQHEIDQGSWSPSEFEEITKELVTALQARQHSQRFLAKVSEYAWLILLLAAFAAVFAGFRFFSNRDAGEAGWQRTPIFTHEIPIKTATLPPGVEYDTYDVKEALPLREIALTLAIPIQSLSILNGYAPEEVVPAGVRLKLPAPYSPGIPVPTPVTPPAPKPTLESDVSRAVIVTRMQTSRSNWRTLWLDGVVIHYGPPDYVGEPFIQREQIWISEPSYALYLQSDYQGQLSQAYIKNTSRLAVLNIASGERKFSPPEQVFGSISLVNLIYPLNMFGVSPVGAFTYEGEDTVAGRRCLILSVPGQFTLGMYSLSTPESQTRLCIDAETGLILRSENVRQADGLPIQTIEVRRVVYNQNFPTQLFDLYEYLPDGFAANEHGEPETAENALPDVQLVQHPARALPDMIEPPPGFDASQSTLEVKIIAMEDPLVGPITFAVFAEGYFLGTLGNSTSGIATCDRSSDGRYLAYTTYLMSEDVDLPSVVFTITDLASFSPVYQNGLPLLIWTYDFSPDNHQIAMAACPDFVDSSPICDLIVLDLETGLDRLVVEDILAQRVAWSPDGQYLAFDGFGFGVDPNTASSSELFMLRADTGELVYQGRIDPTTGEVPQDSPAAGWFERWPDGYGYVIDRCLTP